MPTRAEIESAMASIRIVIETMPIEFSMSDHHPLDYLMHALGVLSGFEWKPASTEHSEHSTKSTHT